MSEEISSADFFSDCPPPRIIGTESECNIQFESRKDDYMHRFISASAIRRAGHKSKDGFLDNGSRIYPDDKHLEIDTAECLGPRQAAAADLANVILLRNVVKASRVRHDGLYRQSGTMIDGVQETSGHHQNFLIPRSIADDPVFRKVIIGHLASSLWMGAGTITNRFELSQKIGGIGGEPISDSKTRAINKGNKPMATIQTADHDKRTIGGNKEWARFEVRLADPGFSPTARYLGLAATSLVLRLLEHQQLVDARDLLRSTFRDNLQASSLFSRDLSFSATASTIQRGKSIAAVDYQEKLALAAQKLSERIELPDDEREAIEPWLEICDSLRLANLYDNEYAGLLTKLEFAPRYRYLRRYFEDNELHSFNVEARQINLEWDRISPIGGGLAYWSSIPSPHIDPPEIEYLVRHAPRTRAAIRGGLIASDFGPITGVYWSFIDSDHGRIHLNNPYTTITT